MATIRRFLLRALNFFRPSRADADLARELEAHFALIEEDFRRRGLSEGEARVAARRALKVGVAAELHREARSLPWLEDVRRDIGYAVRTLSRTPAFTIAAVLTLALAIGGTTAIFSVVNAVLLRPLPFPSPDRLAMVFEENAKSGFPKDAVRPRDYAAWSADNEAFDELAAVADYAAVLEGGDEPERLIGRRVSRSFFPLLGIAPLHGRFFTAAEDTPGGPRVVILSYGLWQRRFGGNPAIVGSEIRLSGEPHVVVGVMPQAFQFVDGYVRVWRPAAFSSEELTRGARYLGVVGRLKQGVTSAGAAANLDAIAGRMARMNPGDERWQSLRSVIVPLDEQLAGAASRPMSVLLGAVAVVLLIACANLASLLLARTAARRPELMLRGALGASRGRLIRQLLIESTVLAGLGLALGLVLAWWSFAFLEQLVPAQMALFAQPSLDARTLAVALLASVGTVIAFGLAPALQTTAIDTVELMRSSTRTVSGGRRGRGVLVAAEVAMTLVLLVAAGLLVQTLYKLRYADLGMRPQGVLTLRTALLSERYADSSRRWSFYDSVLERVEHIPGVIAAGYTTSVPLEWKGATSQFSIDGQAPDPSMPYDANHRQVSAGYLQAMGFTLREGRFFAATDDERSAPVVIVNQAMARRYWTSGSPVGRRIAIDPNGRRPEWRTIVGIVGDVRQMGLDLPSRPEVYIPFRQLGWQPWFAPRDLAVRTTGDPADFTSAIKAQIHAVDPTLAISNIRPMNEVLDEEVAERRVGTTTLVAFAAFALVLAILGIYGVIAYFVVQHIPEIGVRVALGAQPRDVMRWLVGKGVSLAAIGVAVGIGGGLVTTRMIKSLLVGVEGSGLIMCLAAGAVLLILAFAASAIPARRALRQDPIAALRAQ